MGSIASDALFGMSGQNELDGSIRIVVERIATDAAAYSGMSLARRIGVEAEVGVMIEQPPLVVILDDGVMIGATIDGSKDNTLILEWTERRIADTVGNTRLVAKEGSVTI